ncbi:ATP-binding protein [Streptomyces sp. MB09-01]|uniref:ATP-binding protein n=1 Tax=Streptomyces sp. MB09-01 TaxID=3028666 RepID=UPI0029AA3C2C|nr:ATP-binding protein [Streptomyces sp. MB09-01]MDX3537271.1 ATP-binding protein [Streptomyces sp. MB09-01]
MATPVLDRHVQRMGRPTASAREATRAFLLHAARVRSPTRPENPDGVLLVVAELVTNALRHTDGPCTLHLGLHQDHIDIRVTDSSSRPPQPRPPHTDGTGGWGWHLIHHLTTHVHISRTPDGGKAICAHAPW